MSPTIRETRELYRAEASSRRVDPRHMDLLLADAMDRELVWLVAHDEETIPSEVEDAFHEMVLRRFRGEPLQYIRGFCEFYGRRFETDVRALVPRPETEHVVEAVIDRAPRNGRVLDVGTGCGAIGASIALERPDLRVFASDIATDALFLAKRNVSTLGARVPLVASDSVDALTGSFDVIASNPPYVPEGIIPSLQTEVRDWEPRVALTAGPDEYRIVRRLIEDGPRILGSEGFIVMEIGFSQRDAVMELARSAGWSDVEFVDDLAAIPRVAMLSGWAGARE
ncbi:MAG: peptide chain release factor N(5)-glutamine methyltransferase [Acidobacteria bacterium]|nr:peptide chain release factor N(5)-glutamine methyltransferase [Acidobacteriota bacterium]